MTEKKETTKTTVRLESQLIIAAKRMALENKASKATPDTFQKIVNESLREFLQKEE